MLNTINCFFNRAADHLELNEQLREILLTPNRVVRVEIVTEKDSSSVGKKTRSWRSWTR